MADKTIKNRPKHLFKPGQSGNPNGRPKGAGISITTAIKRELEKIPEGQKATYLDLLVKKILKKGIIDGDNQTQKNIWNYVDGLPESTTNLKTESPLVVNNYIQGGDKIAEKYEKELKDKLKQ